MTLVDRYLGAVRFFLPHRQQDDIVRELSENLASEIEHRSGGLGRELSEKELSDILRRHGHPVLVAGRYSPQQQLIGPVWFPIYLLTLKLGLGVALAITVVVAVVGAAVRGGSVAHFVDGMLAYPNRALIVFAWTTIGFAALDLIGRQTQLKADWDPRKIPDWMVAGRRPVRLHDRVHAAVEVMFGTAALCWLLLVPTWPWLVLGPLASVLAFAPVWRLWYVPIVVVAIANLSLDAYGLFQPARTPRIIRFKLAALASQLVVALMVLSARIWVVAGPAVRPDVIPSAQLPQLLTWVNRGIAIGFGVVILITLIEIGKQYYRLRTLGDGRHAAGAEPDGASTTNAER
jgi:hypothetical protein